MRKLIILTFLLLASGAAQAAPSCTQQGASVLFHCKIEGSDREVTICDLPKNRYLYKFGKPGEAPELEIKSSQDEVVYTPWNGIGNAIWARLGFRNKGYLYDVGRSIEKGGEQAPVGYVDIYAPGKDTPIATKHCRAGTVRGNLDDLWDRFN